MQFLSGIVDVFDPRNLVGTSFGLCLVNRRFCWFTQTSDVKILLSIFLLEFLLADIVAYLFNEAVKRYGRSSKAVVV